SPWWTMPFCVGRAIGSEWSSPRPRRMDGYSSAMPSGTLSASMGPWSTVCSAGTSTRAAHSFRASRATCWSAASTFAVLKIGRTSSRLTCSNWRGRITSGAGRLYWKRHRSSYREAALRRTASRHSLIEAQLLQDDPFFSQRFRARHSAIAWSQKNIVAFYRFTCRAAHVFTGAARPGHRERIVPANVGSAVVKGASLREEDGPARERLSLTGGEAAAKRKVPSESHGRAHLEQRFSPAKAASD